jgi:hypothetical protein
MYSIVVTAAVFQALMSVSKVCLSAKRYAMSVTFETFQTPMEPP